MLGVGQLHQVIINHLHLLRVVNMLHLRKVGLVLDLHGLLVDGLLGKRANSFVPILVALRLGAVAGGLGAASTGRGGGQLRPGGGSPSVGGLLTAILL